MSNIRLATENLTVTTLIEETFVTIKLLEPIPSICISVNETAIEKWVSLTRRIVAIERQQHYDDPTLIRHVYDLYAIIKANKLNNDFLELAKVTINNDAEQFKSQHPEYFADPSNEIQHSLTILKNKALWKARFQHFIEVMVYDKNFMSSYEHAIECIENISSKAINSRIIQREERSLNS